MRRRAEGMRQRLLGSARSAGNIGTNTRIYSTMYSRLGPYFFFPGGASPFRSHFGTGRIQFCLSLSSITFSSSLFCNSTFSWKTGVVSPLNRLSTTRRSSPLNSDWKRQGSSLRSQRLQLGSLRSHFRSFSWHCRHGRVRFERTGFLVRGAVILDDAYFERVDSP